MRSRGFGAGPAGGRSGNQGEREQARFDQLIAEISTMLLSTIGTVANSVELSLLSVAKYFGAERAYITEVATDSGSTPPSATSKTDIRSATNHRVVTFGSSPAIRGRIAEDFPGEFTWGAPLSGETGQPSLFDSGQSTSRGHRSELVVPLKSGEVLVGTLTLEKGRLAPDWPAETEERLHLLAGIFSAGIVRQKIDHSLRSYSAQVESTLRAERDRAQLYLQTADVMLAAIDRSGVIVLINRKGCEQLGYEESELVGKNWFELCVPAVERERTWEAFQKMLTGDVTGVDYFENRLVTKKGEERYFFFFNAFIRDDNGLITGILSSGRDYTERKRIREKLVQNEQKYRAIFESFQDVFYRTDMEGKVILVSPSVSTLLGYSPEEILGTQATDYYADDPAWREAYVQRLLSEDHVNDFELRMKTRDGRTIDVSVNAHVLRDGSGNPVGFEGVLRDITERKKTESILRSLVKGTASAFGRPFFRSLVRSMAEGLGCRYVQIAELSSSGSTAHTLAVWNGKKFERNFEYSIAESAARAIGSGTVSLHMGEGLEIECGKSCFGVSGVASFIGTPLTSTVGEPLGFLILIDDKRMPTWVVETAKHLIVIAAARASAELLRLKSERELRRTYEELRQANEKMSQDQVALTERNITLKMVLEHIEQEKEGYRQEICANLEQALSPFVRKLQDGNGRLGGKDLAALSDLVGSMVGRGVDSFKTKFTKLSPRETEICELIMEGHPSKDISDILGISVETIHKHREIIRRKLGIQHIDINLATYLRSKFK